MDVESFLTTDRLRRSSHPRSKEQEFESDKGRLLFCRQFRRLAQKTQVFAMETNAAVRNRLIHSLEVAQIGRYIVSEWLCTPQSESILAINNNKNPVHLSLPLIVETACLMHDIGNPPFGHFGERGIQEWFKTHQDEFRSKLPDQNKSSKPTVNSNSLFDRLFKDFTEFDGNAQGFRIATKTQGYDGKTGLNLTCTQLAATMKYPVAPYQTGQENKFSKKPSYFSTEEKVALSVWSTLKMKPNTRSPWVYIMEAADDICYATSDIEDGIEKGVIRFSDFLREIKSFIKEWNETEKPASTFIRDLGKACENNLEEIRHNKLQDDETLLKIKVFLNKQLVKFAATRFAEETNEFSLPHQRKAK